MRQIRSFETLMGVTDRCVRVMGGTGVSTETIVELAFREIRDRGYSVRETIEAVRQVLIRNFDVPMSSPSR